jgi:hypothetical protein
LDHERIARKILESKLGEKRIIGRPRLRWLEDAEKDLRETNVKRWRQNAIDRVGHP